MCGITGYYGRGDEDTLRRMTATLTHRGPDDDGFFISKDGRTGLGFRRLSIIDIAHGRQPVAGEDGSARVIFNGEIYNFKELREELRGLGHAFATASDTEVIVHGYEAWGEQVFARLWGMFAIAIWDDKKKILLLARDRLGKKPLYYGVWNQTFIFGSEAKAILAHPDVPRVMDAHALDLFLIFECVPTPYTIWHGMGKLLPGSYLVYDGKTTRMKSFWSLPREQSSIGEVEALDGLDELLTDAVRRRLVADVPLGIFLSGGIDSAAITAYASRVATSRLKTFSIGFSNKTYDERPFARMVAHQFGTDHHEIEVSERDALDAIRPVFASLDEPFADPSVIPTYILSHETRKHVTVAVGGDGGDELFLGYPTYTAHHLAKLIRPVMPHFLRAYLGEWIESRTSSRYMSTGFKLSRFLRGAGEGNAAVRDLLFRAPFTLRDAGEIRGHAVMQEIEEQLRAYEKETPANPLEALYFRAYLMDQVLAKVDRASMMASLEVRAPFLDHRVVKLVLSLPSTVRGTGGKQLLKKLMRGKIPDSIIDRSKHGFALPTADWLRGALAPEVRELLNPEKVRREGIFDPTLVARMADDHARGRDRRKELWTLLAFAWWCRAWQPTNIV